jgi:hypothetical protein
VRVEDPHRYAEAGKSIGKPSQNGSAA